MKKYQVRAGYQGEVNAVEIKYADTMLKATLLKRQAEKKGYTYISIWSLQANGVDYDKLCLSI